MTPDQKHIIYLEAKLKQRIVDDRKDIALFSIFGLVVGPRVPQMLGFSTDWFHAFPMAVIVAMGLIFFMRWSRRLRDLKRDSGQHTEEFTDSIPELKNKS